MFRKIAFAIAVLTSFSASAQTLERPSVKVGDECHHDIFDNLRKDDRGNIEKIAERRSVVTSVEGDRINISSTHKILVPRDTGGLEDNMATMDRDLNTVESNGRKFEPASPSRFYPLSPGAEKKNAKTNFQRQRRDGESSVTLNGKASNWGKIVVPAGTFDVITITWEGHYTTSTLRGNWSGRTYREVVLSPATWCQVSSVFKDFQGSGAIWTDRTWRLTSFKN